MSDKSVVTTREQSEMSLILRLIALTAVISIATCANNKVRWPRVLLLGDSLTQLAFSNNGHWGSFIYDRLARRADVLNRGVGGFTTVDYLKFLDEAMIDQDTSTIAAVTLMLGTNDAGHRLPLLDYSNNLVTLINRIINDFKITPDKIILMCPPCVDRDKKNVDIGPFANAALDVGGRLNVTTLNLFELFSKDVRKGELFVDGVHFSPPGSDLVFDKLWPIVEDKVNRFIAQP